MNAKRQDEKDAAAMVEAGDENGAEEASADVDRQFVTALARGLDVLSCFQAGDRALSNREIATRTGLAKSTITRLTYTLTQLGFLKQVEDSGRYRVGPGVLGLGYVALANMKVREMARPLMQDLAEYANGLVSMAVRDRLSMIYVENCRARNTATLRVNVGMQMPIATTSIGRAFLAALPAGERDFLLEQVRKKDPQGWTDLAPGIEQALSDYQERGFCLSAGEWQKDTNGVAVPLVCPDGDIVAFSVSGPAFAMARRQLEEDLGPRLLYMVRNLEVMLHNA
jgi:DNA-binding IclR family transcriptional regulator